MMAIVSRFRWVGLLGIVVLLLAVFVLLEALRGGPFGFDDVTGKSRSYLPILLTLGTFAGIVGRTALPSLLADSSESALHILKASFGIRRLIAAAILSPLVIGYFYSTVRDLDDLFLVFILSFQNGFFWDTVISAVRAKIQGTARPEATKIE
ncbi:hypothetical protein HFO06_28700 [Rhizobium leguminosarum]|uniref:hypothetical protein n=1 Tax=Rhizobium leguminosarum TaxID=384 RepID=UPI001C93AC32|nr:hypothetical protein [Rhizobium leguminosarum]MBY5767031.1 hypothetical protein [Rhizobium leguminosarum]